MGKRDFIQFRVGYFDKGIAAAGTVVGLLCVAVLMAWFHFFEPDLANTFPPVSSAALHWVILTGVLFAFINATLEEAIFRELVLQTLRQRLSDNSANFIQALLFGFAHIGVQSVPHGWSGFILTATFGLLLGAVRIIFEGLGAAIWIHIIADLGVYFLLLQ